MDLELIDKILTSGSALAFVLLLAVGYLVKRDAQRSKEQMEDKVKTIEVLTKVEETMRRFVDAVQNRRND